MYQDNLATTKFKVTGTLFELIVANPFEQVRAILETIINKLGDPEYKIASRIIYDIKNYCKYLKTINLKHKIINLEIFLNI